MCLYATAPKCPTWSDDVHPDGLAGNQIPWLGRLLAVADVLDALSSDRSYRGAYGVDRAVTMIVDDAGRHFDPVIAVALGALHARGELQRLAARGKSTDL